MANPRVIVIPDDVIAAQSIRPDARALINGMTVVMSHDNLRMYVGESTWKAMQESYALTAKRS